MSMNSSYLSLVCQILILTIWRRTPSITNISHHPFKYRYFYKDLKSLTNCYSGSGEHWKVLISLNVPSSCNLWPEHQKSHSRALLIWKVCTFKIRQIRKFIFFSRNERNPKVPDSSRWSWDHSLTVCAYVFQSVGSSRLWELWFSPLPTVTGD